MTQYHPILIDAPARGPYLGHKFANPQPYPLHADTADFTDYGDRAKLATLGIFSVDKLQHRAKRDRETATRLMYEAAYREYGLDRKREHDRIAAEMEATLTAGIWAKSTGEYARRCRELDVTIAERVYERVV